jgi:hypothetical protein
MRRQRNRTISSANQKNQKRKIDAGVALSFAMYLRFDMAGWLDIDQRNHQPVKVDFELDPRAPELVRFGGWNW